MSFKNTLNIIHNFKEKYKLLSFECEINDISCKIYITRIGDIKADKKPYGAEINIFNNSLDYDLINYGGETITHNFYEDSNDKLILDLIDKTIIKLSENCFD